MLLVVEPFINEIGIYTFKQDRRPGFECFKKSIDENTTPADLSEFISSLTDGAAIEAVSFRIPFGAGRAASPAVIDADFIGGLRKHFSLYPFYYPTLEKILNIFRKAFHDVPLYAFFETSFFHTLPEEEKLYALPYDYSESNNIRRYGFHGIFHKYHADFFPEGKRVISVVFDKQTTVCSLKSGKPLSINFGLTQLEGIMGRTSCGDIDAGIIFYLMRRYNFSIHRIDNLLKRHSGFLGLTGLNMGIKELFKLYGKDKKVTTAFDIYKNHVLKYIGESLAVLGGADALIIGGNFAPFLKPLVYSLLKQLSFLGISCLEPSWKEDGDITMISRDDSAIRVYMNNLHESEVIFKETERIILDEKNNTGGIRLTGIAG